MPREDWFDGQTLALHRDDFLDENPDWQQYLADGVVLAHEILEQEAKITGMLRELEPKLSDGLHEEITRILLEYEVLVNMALLHVPSLAQGQEAPGPGAPR
ncbi:MAG: hypothetical protein ACOX9B_03280 [Candidatus Xenobium sp.]|jgi:hypothetical protein|nr:hypothetical protein [Burkholderiales bacterium]